MGASEDRTAIVESTHLNVGKFGPGCEALDEHAPSVAVRAKAHDEHQLRRRRSSHVCVCE